MNEPQTGVTRNTIGNITVERKISNEKRDLRGRINKLEGFLVSPAMANMNKTQEVLLNLQLEHMIRYEACLEIRLSEILSRKLDVFNA